jgi:VCBS repeat-containing protein
MSKTSVAASVSSFFLVAGAPVAVNDNASTDKNTAFDINVLTNDSFSGIPSIDSINTTGTKGTVSINANNTIHYDPNGQFASLLAGHTATDSFTYKISAGNHTSNSATVTVTINGLNDPPLLSDIEQGVLDYVMGAPATPVTSSLTATSPDTTTLVGAQVSICSGYQQSEDVLGFVPTGNGITGVFSSSSGSMSLHGAATIAQYQTALRSITYGNLSSAPTLGSRSICFQVSDGLASNNLSNLASRAVTVSKAAPIIRTSPDPFSTIVGGTIKDTVTVSGFNPTGTVTFNLYTDPEGKGLPIFTDTESLVNGAATSGGFQPTGPGLYYWAVTYNGDGANSSATSNASDESVFVSQPDLSINGSPQPASATVGSSISNQATVSGGNNPTGTVTFTLYNNSSGIGTPLFTDTEPLVGGLSTSASYTTTATGTDYWITTYSGDSHNSGITTSTAAQPVTITPASPSINTSQLPASAVAGTAIKDSATVSGGFFPIGTVTFKLYNNATASGTPLFTDTEPLSTSTTSASYTPTAPGTDYWVATYNGDSNNNAVTSGAADEPVVISADSLTRANLRVTISGALGSTQTGNLLTGESFSSGRPAAFSQSPAVNFNVTASTPGFTAQETTSGNIETLNMLNSSLVLVLTLTVNTSTGAFTATTGPGGASLVSSPDFVYSYGVTDGLINAFDALSLPVLTVS